MYKTIIVISVSLYISMHDELETVSGELRLWKRLIYLALRDIKVKHPNAKNSRKFLRGPLVKYILTLFGYNANVVLKNLEKQHEIKI